MMAKRTLPPYTIIQGTTFYAVLNVPKAVRKELAKVEGREPRTRFVQSLETADIEVAARRAEKLVAHWKEMIAQAKGSKPPESDDEWFERVTGKPADD